jgi:hypothetical protein
MILKYNVIVRCIIQCIDKHLWSHADSDSRVISLTWQLDYVSEETDFLVLHINSEFLAADINEEAF